MSGEAPAIDALRARVEDAVGSLFAIEEEIGRGGMAVVYRARDLRLRRRVALKVLPPDLAFRQDVKSRFLREAQLSAQLSHPNIVPIYSVEEHETLVYFSMGLVDGETLAQRLSREPRPSVDVVRSMLREVCDALAYAHSRGIVHRDMKPDNILVEHATGRAVVSDFGIARAAEGDLRLTATGVAVGTPAYMSPEQAMGDKEVDGRADIYSLGVVGWQMLAGELPFHAENTPGMLMKHISERPRPLVEVRPDLPTNLVFAIERAMAKGRAERWRDAAEFAAALDEHAPGGPVSRGRVSITGAGGPPPERGDRMFAGVVAGGRNKDGVFSGVRVGIDVAGAVINDLNLGNRHGAPLPAGKGDRDEFPRFPPLPPGWVFDPNTREHGREALREWREQQRLWRERHRPAAVNDEPLSRRELRRLRRAGLVQRTPEEKIRRIQRSVLNYFVLVGVLASINIFFGSRFPWFLFPTIIGAMSIVGRVGGLWVDGIPFRRLFQRQPDTDPARDAIADVDMPERRPRVAAPKPPPLDLSNIPRDVLAGPHGAAVRDAAESKAQIVEVLGKLPPDDRAMLPDIAPTVNGLMERVVALAHALTQLDRDASPDALTRLERRLGEAQNTPTGAPDRDRRIELLERQRATLRDLAESRAGVAGKLDSALLVLQTMKLDLMRLRSSGLESRLSDSLGATQEARAVATDIERVIEAARETNELQQRRER